MECAPYAPAWDALRIVWNFCQTHAHVQTCKDSLSSPLGAASAVGAPPQHHAKHENTLTQAYDKGFTGVEVRLMVVLWTTCFFAST